MSAGAGAPRSLAPLLAQLGLAAELPKFEQQVGRRRRREGGN
jgi:hypothetical protein